jgi:AcrR family transcriptional regulator
MSQQLRLDPESGFMQSVDVSGITFDVDKKRLFLEMYREKPNLRGIARQLGLDGQTIYNHLKSDAEFARQFRDCREAISDRLESRVAEFADKPNHFMDRIAWLRAHRPDKWDPERKVVVQHNVEITKSLASEAREFIDVKIES